MPVSLNELCRLGFVPSHRIVLDADGFPRFDALPGASSATAPAVYLWLAHADGADMDGNGRIGRILIPLFLYQKHVLSQPMFYLSEYLENHREEYYQRLKAISAEGAWNDWIAFFLRATTTQAGQNAKRVAAIKALYDEMKVAIQETTHSQYSVHLLDAIFSKPIFRTSDLAQKLAAEYGIHEKTTPGLLRQLKEAGILRELQSGSGRRAATLCFPRLINLAEGREVL
jgi:hypothetical protein